MGKNKKKNKGQRNQGNFGNSGGHEQATANSGHRTTQSTQPPSLSKPQEVSHGGLGSRGNSRNCEQGGNQHHNQNNPRPNQGARCRQEYTRGYHHNDCWHDSYGKSSSLINGQKGNNSGHLDDWHYVGASSEPVTAKEYTKTQNMKCDVCDTSYLIEGHKPRSLQCGHTLCTYCIKKLIKGKMVTCPQCRSKFQGVQTAEEIPVNFSLIHILEENASRASLERGQPSGSHSSSVTGAINRTSFQPKQKECSPHSSKCLEAGADIVSHCASCQVWLCKECCRIDHQGTECLITPFKETLSEMKQAKKNEAEGAHKNLKESWGEIKNYSDKLESCSATVQITLDCIKKEQKLLEKVLSDGQLAEALLQSVTENLSEIKSVKDALKVFHDVDGSISNTRQWVSSSDSAHLSDRVNKLSKEQLHTIVLLHSTSAGSESTSGVLAVCTRKENQVYSELECDGDRILLHSLKQVTPPSGTRAIPLQAAMLCIDSASALTFLDISLGGSHFGRVFIRLMGDTARGQQFLKLCTGEMGPTFRNSHFHRVWWKSLPGEHVWGGDYDQGDGSGGTPLKIEAIYHDKSRANRRLPISAGLVAGSYEREKASTLFRIYTKDDKSVIEEAAFGRVEYGLHFIDSAINHNNIRDVKICDCGVVIE